MVEMIRCRIHFTEYRPFALKFVRGFYKSTKKSCLVELTSNRYPNVKRKPFSKVENVHLKYFEDVIGSKNVITDATELLGYNTDWLKTCRGHSSVLLRPRSTEDVSLLLSYCNKHNLAVCPQGGNTGLVGGSVPVFDEIILSTTLMNQIISLDSVSGSLVCQSGCILEHLDQHVETFGMMMPLDLGAKGSCQIGGNVSTNAGGLRVIRYGSLHNSILGLEVVLPSGKILDCLSTLKKDNTGYDVKRLFIGSEGTLGVVTKVAIQCPPRPQSINLAFLGCDSFTDVLRVFKDGRRKLGEVLSSFEFMDNYAMTNVVNNLHLKNPISSCSFYVLIETAGAEGKHDEEKLNSFLEDVMQDKLVSDGTLATNPGHVQKLWQIRERIAESHVIDGYTYKYDVSVPLDRFYEPVEIMRERIGSSVINCCGYGHLGDGNLHLNMTTKQFDADILSQIEPFIYELMKSMNGSISAEHGLGFKKKDFIRYTKSESAVEIMRQFKHVLDPKGIMNPYKVLP